MKITRAEFQRAISQCIRDLFAMHDDISESDKQIIVALEKDGRIHVTEVCDFDFAVTFAIHLLKKVVDSKVVSKEELLAHVFDLIDRA